jgi:hypothetical protein
MGGKNHRNGGKAGGRHTTIIDAAGEVFDFISSIPAVSNVTAGQIKSNLHTAPHRVTVKEITGCLSVKVRGTKCIQELMVYSKDLKGVQETLERKYG